MAEEIVKLVTASCVLEVSYCPEVCSPLLVVNNSKGKKSLVLDLRMVNKRLPKCKFKYEGINLIPDMCSRGDFPHYSQEVFGGCSCLLFGDFGQLPPVMDLPLYTTDPRSELSDEGRAAYQTFQQAVVLDQVMCQAGQDPEQVKFRDILL